MNQDELCDSVIVPPPKKVLQRDFPLQIQSSFIDLKEEREKTKKLKNNKNKYAEHRQVSLSIPKEEIKIQYESKNVNTVYEDFIIAPYLTQKYYNEEQEKTKENQKKEFNLKVDFEISKRIDEEYVKFDQIKSNLQHQLVEEVSTYL